MPPPSISPQLQKQMQLNKDRDARKKVPGIRHPLLLSFIAGKLAFKHIYEDDDSLYDAIKSTPVFLPTPTLGDIITKPPLPCFGTNLDLVFEI